MRLRRVRFTVRRMMLAVAIMAVVAGGTVIVKRQRVYRVRAVFYAEQEQGAATRLQHWAQEAIRLSDRPRSDERRLIAESMEDYSRNRVAHHARLKLKYRRAARFPWLSVAPDPPSPDGVNAPL